ncbi:MAG: citrate synthase [Myxococcota bacterium]|nr:citrate synthase [Myxococcota bacterium]
MADADQHDTGLEGVVVADTRLSDVDGQRGKLVIADQDVEVLAGARPFEEVCALLWGATRDEVAGRIGQARAEAFNRLPCLGDALDRGSGMDALRAGLAHANTSGDALTDATSVVGAAAVIVSAWLRTRARAAPISPDSTRGHSEDFLRMALGAQPAPQRSRALDTYLVTVCDHGMNASTFTARVVASTGSDMISAVVAAVGALKGPLHGGAPGPVLDMLDAIGTPEKARAWLEGELHAGRRIMGMGHRIYRVRDPRAAVFERQIERLAESAVDASADEVKRMRARLALARAVEHEAESLLSARHPDRPLRANVEFFTAVLLEAIGLPRESFAPTFALGRAAGWCAHVMEQRARGRLIRPASRYIGATPA